MLRAGLFMTMAMAAAAPAVAQSVVLTADDGRPLMIGTGAELGNGLRPSTAGAKDIVDEFRRLCLPNPADAPARVAASSFGLSDASVVFPARGKQPEARLSQWRGPSASLSVWAGDEAGLKGQPIVITQRAYQVTGVYGPFRAEGAQCNLVVSLLDFAAAVQVAEALTASLGIPGKLVTKKTFSDGYWQVADVRVNFTAPTVRSGAQPVVMSAQLFQKGSKR